MLGHFRLAARMHREAEHFPRQYFASSQFKNRTKFRLIKRTLNGLSLFIYKMGMLMSKILSALFGCALLLCSSLLMAAESGYCDSRSNRTYFFWQNAVTINEASLTTADNRGYLYAPDSGLELVPGENTITLMPGYRSYNYPLYWRGWLDLNEDGQFTSDEQLFQAYGRGPINTTVTLPDVFANSTATLRIAMKYGSYPNACQIYSYGETEDLVVTLQQPEQETVALEDTYHLTADGSFKVTRNGAIGDDVTWVVEKNGAVVLSRSAQSELEYKYYSNTQASDLRIWLEQYIDGAYQRVSNIVEYTPGTTDLFDLQLSAGYQINRSGELGVSGNLTWVIEMDGNIVLERLAANEVNYLYYRNWAGTKFRVWLKQFINGQYEVVSNTVEYQTNQTEFELTLDQKYKLARNGQPGDQVRWIVEENGLIIVDRDAATEMSYTFVNSQPGSRYQMWLQMNIDGQNQVVSNIVTYDEPLNYDYTLALGPDYELTRSGVLGDDLTWVIVKDGTMALQRGASNELTFNYFSLSGSHIEAYLNQWVDGYNQRVSNVVRYEVKDFGYRVYVDPDYGLSRSGTIGEPLVWVVEENGQQVLQQDASQAINYTYPGNTPGSAYRVWLGMVVDGTFRPVSDVVYYQVPVVQPPEPPFTIVLGTDYVITRDGRLGDPLRWVVEQDGIMVANMEAYNALSFVYPAHQSGAHYRIWLEDDISGEIASNEVEYVYSEAAAYTLVLNEDYSIERSGQLGEPLEWVLEENGVERWRDDATYQPDFYFPFPIEGGVYRVWLVEQGSQNVVSDVITYTYIQPGSSFTITSNGDNTITRSGYLGDPLSWVVEENGVVVGNYSARDSLEFNYENGVPGAHYRIWLTEEGRKTALSNIVSYQESAAAQYEYSISLNTDGSITRSGAVGDQVDLVFLQNGRPVAGMDASRDLVLSFSFLNSGDYQVYLQSWPDAEPEQQVSNVLDISVQ